MYITNPNRRRKILAEERSRAAAERQAAEQQAQEVQSKVAAEPQASQNLSRDNDITTQEQDLTGEQNAQEENLLTGTGYIVVRVTTASGAIPLQDARVTLREYTDGDGDIIAVKTTNLSGLTEKIPLPAPERSGSLGAGRGKAYASYYIQVDKEGYSPQHYINVPVFDGIVAVQNADMVPLPENGEGDRYDPYAGIFYESENPKLSGTSPKN